MQKLFGLLLVLLLVTAATAQPDRGPGTPPPRQCSVATLRGDYLYAQSGADVKARTTFAQSGRESYDGAGKAKGVFTFSDNGVIKRGTYNATYTMKADCTGTITITDSLKSTSHYDLYTTPTAEEIAWIQTDPNTVFAGWNRRRPMPPMGMGSGPR